MNRLIVSESLRSAPGTPALSLSVMGVAKCGRKAACAVSEMVLSNAGQFFPFSRVLFACFEAASA